VTWWLWTLLWVVLVAAALGVFFLIGRGLWRKAMALLSELAAASDRLSAVAGELDTINAAAERADELAVFAAPTRLRQQRILDRRRRGGRGRKATGRGSAKGNASR
jgi:hypothetical protein